MFYSPQHGRIVFKNEIATLFNTSLPKDLETQEFITEDIASILGLIHVEPGDPPSDYDEEFQILEYDMLDITYDAEAGTARTRCFATNIFSDELDEEGNVIKTAAQIKEEVEAAKLAAEASENERVQQEELANNVGHRQWLLDTSAKYVLDDYEGDDKNDWIAFREEIKALVDRDDWGAKFTDFPKSPTELALDAASREAYEAEMAAENLESSE